MAVNAGMVTANATLFNLTDLDWGVSTYCQGLASEMANLCCRFGRFMPTTVTPCCHNSGSL